MLLLAESYEHVLSNPRALLLFENRLTGALPPALGKLAELREARARARRDHPILPRDRKLTPCRPTPTPPPRPLTKPTYPMERVGLSAAIVPTQLLNGRGRADADDAR